MNIITLSQWFILFASNKNISSYFRILLNANKNYDKQITNPSLMMLYCGLHNSRKIKIQ
jgi:hypothetical protein